MNILIVEDDASVRNSLHDGIKRKGYSPIAVAKPEEAESIIKVKPVQIIIMDVMLPGKNGVELVRKLRDNLSDSVAIFFMSGIYRDKAYIYEALKNSDATDYLIKPFNIDELIEKIDKVFKSYADTPAVATYMLLSASINSNRERKKYIEQIETLDGYDLPFVLSILLDSSASGHLNVIDEKEEIYGITFAEGTISRVDSTASELMIKRKLIQGGFITELELSEISKKNSDIFQTLVSEGLMSPHVPALVKADAAFEELKKVLKTKSLKINFVADRKLKAEPGNIDVAVFSEHLHDILINYIPLPWLKKFYSPWIGHAIRLGPQFSDFHLYANLPLFQQLTGFLDQLKSEATLEELLVNCPQFNEVQIYKALHFLMLRRVLVFEESRKVKNLDDHIQRIRSMHRDLLRKNPMQILEFFGLKANAKAIDMQKTYKDFARSYHPDVLSQHVNDDVRKTSHELFAIVTNAFDIMGDPQKKEKYLSEQKQNEAERQLKSDDMVAAAASSLARGRYSEALPLAKAAVELYESEKALLHYWWACFKVDGQMNAELAARISQVIKGMSAGAKKAAYYAFVQGLLKKYNNDIAGAYADFVKALQINENFMDARREIVSLKSQVQEKKGEDILSGDISLVFKRLFKKKGA